jgi:radical SAM/Cys-rich protein
MLHADPFRRKPSGEELASHWRMAMNEFDQRIMTVLQDGLHSTEIRTLQVNMGLRCNQQCHHCHLEASPCRTEMMEWGTMALILEAAGSIPCSLVDLTGGAPELNPHFRKFVKTLRNLGYPVQVRTNLTVLLEPEMEGLPDFYRDHQVRLVASLPCYLEENVCAQRGEGVYEKSIGAIQRLNAVGYGTQPSLPLHLVYNPGGPFLPPAQSSLEADYRKQLGDRFGIFFNRLFTLTNMPIGRFLRILQNQRQEKGYLELLRKSFNPGTLDGLMCRHQIGVGWNGMLYDCDFNLALSLPVDHGAPDHIRGFRVSDLLRGRIVTGSHCFACTAGFGSSCGGALI